MRSGQILHTQAQTQDRGQRSLQHDPGPHPSAACRLRRDHHPLNQAPKRLPRLALRVRFRQSGNQAPDALLVGVGDPGGANEVRPPTWLLTQVRL